MALPYSSFRPLGDGNSACEYDEVSLLQHSQVVSTIARSVLTQHSGVLPGTIFLEWQFFVVLLAIGLAVCLAFSLATQGKALPGLKSKVIVWSLAMTFSILACIVGCAALFGYESTDRLVLGGVLVHWVSPLPVVFCVYILYEVLTGRAWSVEQKIGFLVAAIVANSVFIAVSVWLMQEQLRCAFFWCTAGMQPMVFRQPHGPAPLHIGALLFFVCGGMAITFVVVLCTLPQEPLSPTAPLEDAQRHRRLLLRPGTWQAKERLHRLVRMISGAFLAVIILPTMLVLSGLLPNTWHYMTASEIGEGLTTPLVPYGDAEFATAWMSSFSIKITGMYYIKVYPDVLMYYAFLEVLAVFSVVAAAMPSFERWLSKRVFYNSGLSRGEGAVAVMFFVLSMAFIFYWLHDHTYHDGTVSMNSSGLERLARTWGQTAILYMGLLLLPASKNSLWLKALGVSWERGLWVHKKLGVLCLVFMTCHILTFWARFAQMDLFPHDAFAFLLYYPINGAATHGKYGNYVIGMMQLIAYPSIIMVSVSALLRRNGGEGHSWERFKYFHYVFLVLVPGALFHAPSSWYFLLGGCAFYLVDAAVRFVGVVSSPTRVLRVEVAEASGHTWLTFDRCHDEPGQFAWIRVPMISDWEWHPFAISSAPSDGRMEMCIKSMGRGTWTGQLITLARDACGREDPWPVQLDGPYGPPLFSVLADNSGILLVAGGIGVVQLHGIFRELAAYYTECGELPGSLRFVRLLWVAKDEQLLERFTSSISACLAGVPVLVMSAELFSTQPGPKASGGRLIEAAGGKAAMDEPPELGSKMGSGILVKDGRPEFRHFYEAGAKALADGETLLVHACGPPPMVDAAACVADEFPSISFRTESWSW